MKIIFVIYWTLEQITDFWRQKSVSAFIHPRLLNIPFWAFLVTEYPVSCLDASSLQIVFLNIFNISLYYNILKCWNKKKYSRKKMNSFNFYQTSSVISVLWSLIEYRFIWNQSPVLYISETDVYFWYLITSILTSYLKPCEQ